LNPSRSQDAPGGGCGDRGAFYGRRKGKGLRPGQDDLLRTLLPRVRAAPSDPGAAFAPPVAEIRLEIGFGGGEHLLAQARAHPEVGFVGCEAFVNGVAKVLAVLARDDIRNLRIWDGDAAELIRLMPPGSLGRVYLLYPDPWPKRRHRKRRFISPDNLAALARLMRPGAELRFATDIDDYAGWALARVLASPSFRWTAGRAADWRRPWDGWPGTRYEAKARREGRQPIYLTFERI
jgi:tRNA (guanine-N7-)-methyltransferase